jgi:hypothetical protein
MVVREIVDHDIGILTTKSTNLGTISSKERQTLTAYCIENKISHEKHLEALHELGWTESEYLNGCKGLVHLLQVSPPSLFLRYSEAVNTARTYYKMVIHSIRDRDDVSHHFTEEACMCALKFIFIEGYLIHSEAPSKISAS